MAAIVSFWFSIEEISYIQKTMEEDEVNITVELNNQKPSTAIFAFAQIHLLICST